MSESKWGFVLKILVLCGALAAGCFWMTQNDDPWLGPLIVQQVVGWIGVVFFCGGGLLAVFATVFNLSRFGLQSPEQAAGNRRKFRSERR